LSKQRNYVPPSRRVSEGRPAHGHTRQREHLHRPTPSRCEPVVSNPMPRSRVDNHGCQLTSNFPLRNSSADTLRLDADACVWQTGVTSPCMCHRACRMMDMCLAPYPQPVPISVRAPRQRWQTQKRSWFGTTRVSTFTVFHIRADPGGKRTAAWIGWVAMRQHLRSDALRQC
jgi:hypothetical protein